MNQILTQIPTETSIENKNTIQFGNVGIYIPASHSKHPISNISTLLPNGIEVCDRQVFGVDWSRKEVLLYGGKDVPVQKHPTLAIAAVNNPNSVWFLESTADSFELQNRDIDLQAIKSASIEAYTFPPQFTSKYRIQHKNIAKTDEADAKVIYMIGTTTSLTCSRFKKITRNDPLRDIIQQTLIKDRQYDGEFSGQMAQKYLPKFEDVPLEFRDFLYCKPTSKSKPPKTRNPVGRFLIIASKIREAKLGWRTFVKQIGCYGQGYRGMSRSEFFWWTVRPVFNQRMTDKGLKKTVKNSHVDPKTHQEKLVRIWSKKEKLLNKQTMKGAGKALKWLWRLTAA